MRKIEEQIIKAIEKQETVTLSIRDRVECIPDFTTKVILWNTCIIEIDYLNHKLILNNGGYYTPTTKSRMNTILHGLGYDYGIIQKNRKWFVVNGDTWKPYNNFMTFEI